MVTINVVAGDYEDGASEITGEHFGNIYTTYRSFDKISEADESGGFTLGGLRWPDGSRSENFDEDVVYSLTNPNLHVQEGKGLTDMLELANEKGVPLSIIIPTKRYLEELGTEYDPNDANDLRNIGMNDVKDFLNRLLDGEFGSFPNGLTLEIGNESAYIGWQGGEYINSGSYGELANLFLTAIAEVYSERGITPDDSGIKIGIQSGANTWVATAISDQIDTVVNPATGFTNSGLIDSILNHEGLNGTADEFSFTDLEEITDIWFNLLGTLPELYFSAWNVGKAIKFYNPDGSPITTYIRDGEEFSMADVLIDQDIGARQAAGTVAVFSYQIALGADAMALWGTVGTSNSYYWFTDWQNDEKVVYREQTSHGGEALRMLNESLIGTRLLDGVVINGMWTQNPNATNYNSFAYADNAKVVLFLTAGDINDSSGLDVNVNLSGFGSLEYVWVEVIRTRIAEGYEEFIGTPYERLYEIPVITRLKVVLDDNGNFIWHFEEDYETVRIIATKDNPTGGHIILWGDETDDYFTGWALGDWLRGGEGDDMLVGRDGHDRLLGGNGNDIVKGNWGNDLLFGGIGDDQLYGGTGEDNIHGDHGGDVIYGGEGNDTIHGAEGEDLMRGGLGNDVIWGGDGNDIVLGNGNNDLLFGGLGDDQVHGGTGDDVIYGDHGGDVIYGGEGNDTIHGAEGEDIMRGGLGNDMIFGGDGGDVLRGGWGNDRLYGGLGDDILSGGMGDDVLKGEGGSDTFLFTNDQNGRDVIIDFEDGIDILNINHHNGGFDTLTISETNGNTTIIYDSGIIVLLDTSISSITEDDFIF
jgi:Ca2+-binding RTX toxin-like protein